MRCTDPFSRQDDPSTARLRALLFPGCECPTNDRPLRLVLQVADLPPVECRDCLRLVFSLSDAEAAALGLPESADLDDDDDAVLPCGACGADADVPCRPMCLGQPDTDDGW